ncbi:MAG: hypothetical protein ACPKQO_02795 [Nitrososphaeraceae archaeon]
MNKIINQRKFGSIIAVLSVILFVGSYNSNVYAEPDIKSTDAIPLKELTKLDIEEIRKTDNQRNSMIISEQNQESNEMIPHQSNDRDAQDNFMKSSSEMNEIQKDNIKKSSNDRNVISEVASNKGPLTSVFPIPTFK